MYKHYNPLLTCLNDSEDDLRRQTNTSIRVLIAYDHDYRVECLASSFYAILVSQVSAHSLVAMHEPKIRCTTMGPLSLD